MRPIDADALIEFCAERWIPLNIDAVNMQPTIQQEKAQLSCEGTTSDLISRQAVIDAIVQCTNCGDEDTLREYVLKHSLDNGWTGGILEALDAVKDLPTVQPEPQWIPIERELPRDGSWNIFTDGKNISVERYKADAIDHFFPNGRWFDLDDAVAWMPLPEVYKEGGERIWKSFSWRTER